MVCVGGHFRLAIFGSLVSAFPVADMLTEWMVFVKSFGLFYGLVE